MYAHDCVFEHVTLVGLRGCWVGLEEQQKQGCACTFIRFFIKGVCVCVCVGKCVCVYVSECVCVCVSECVCKQMCACACVCMQMCVRMCGWVCVCKPIGGGPKGGGR